MHRHPSLVSPSLLAAAAAFALVANAPARAESDLGYAFTHEQNIAFEEGSRRYNNGDGYITNFGPELFPLVPETNGQVYFRSQSVTTPGTGQRLEDGQTSLQIEFKF